MGALLWGKGSISSRKLRLGHPLDFKGCDSLECLRPFTSKILQQCTFSCEWSYCMILLLNTVDGTKDPLPLPFTLAAFSPLVQSPHCIFELLRSCVSQTKLEIPRMFDCKMYYSLLMGFYSLTFKTPMHYAMLH